MWNSVRWGPFVDRQALSTGPDPASRLRVIPELTVGLRTQEDGHIKGHKLGIRQICSINWNVIKLVQAATERFVFVLLFSFALGLNTNTNTVLVLGLNTNTNTVCCQTCQSGNRSDSTATGDSISSRAQHSLQHSMGSEATWRDTSWPPGWGMWTRNTSRTRVFFRPMSVSPFLSSMSAFLSFRIPTQSILGNQRQTNWPGQQVYTTAVGT